MNRAVPACLGRSVEEAEPLVGPRDGHDERSGVDDSVNLE